MAKEFDIRRFKTLDELYFESSMELRPNDILSIRKFGRVSGLVANTAEDVWDTGGIKAILTSAEVMNVVSSSTEDDETTGTGAWYIQVGGLDQDYNLVTETVTMNGTSNVATTTTFIAVNRVRSVFHGSNKANVGTITVTGASSASVMATIPAGYGITQQSHFTVPAGYTLFTTGITLSCYRTSGTGSRTAEVVQMVHVPEANATYRTLTYGISSSGGPYTSNNHILSQTPAKSTLWFEATAEANNTSVTSAAEYILVKENLNFRTEL